MNSPHRRYVISSIYRKITVLYEDNHLLVVHKPANMLSQGDVNGDEDLQSLLKCYLQEKYQKPGNVFLALVQRLDRPVSGLMVLARTSKAAARLSEQIRNRSITKEYLAVVDSAAITSGTLTHYLRKIEKTKKAEVFSQPTPGSLKAVSEVQHLETRHGLSLVSITLHTGRFHQIRAQLASTGMPVIGDMKYGSKKSSDGSIALLCHRISFQHPTRKEEMTFSTNVPAHPPWSHFSQILAK